MGILAWRETIRIFLNFIFTGAVTLLEGAEKKQENLQ